MVNSQDKKILQEMFNGYQGTPLLWQDKMVFDMEQYVPDSTSKAFFKDKEFNSIRLGNLVEKFVSFQIQNLSNAEIIAENLQINKEKETIGELDILFLLEQQPIHLEIIYKFYLFDSNADPNDSLGHWIGPNRRDSLIYKLNKLKNRQLPLLFKPETILAIKNLGIDVANIKQLTCFKAQLFVPYKSNVEKLNPLNDQCITGNYLNYKLIECLKNCQFYIPTKLEWLCKPRSNVKWLNSNTANAEIMKFINENRSPLIWVKQKDNSLQKYFITWW
ncbi:DUF1853 family protein [Winogradskyella vincentii]|uniref:DUF1853 family protein n=1 Tax=Winogradskyella vincentii TaxID=2877122 RepID=A0ABS7XZL1_9FLAO|nr:DUF1853 family protein [Winogradskyella vincentii]MCA0153093.1 DUF1853 family protein [Winogradskyella vincentii]